MILDGAIRESKAVREWSIARLRSEHGNVKVPIRVSDSGAAQLFAGDPRRAFGYETMPLAEVIDGFDRPGPTRYVQLCDLERQLPRLARDVPVPVQAGSLYASPAYAWICGGQTVNPLHFDFNEALLGQIVGKKRFVLYPPEDGSRVSHFLERAIFRTSSLDVFRPDVARFPRLSAATPYEATVGPGDVLYIPYCWWHAMIASEPSISVTWWWEPSRAAHVRHTVRQRSADAVKVALRAIRGKRAGT